MSPCPGTSYIKHSSPVVYELYSIYCQALSITYSLAQSALTSTNQQQKLMLETRNKAIQAYMASQHCPLIQALLIPALQAPCLNSVTAIYMLLPA